MGRKFLDSRYETYIFIIPLFESFNMSPGLSTWENRKLGYQKSGKIGTTRFLEKAIWRVKWWYGGNLSGLFRKEMDFFSIHVIKSLLEGAFSTSHSVSDFKVFFLDRLLCFASVGWIVLKCSEFGHAWRLGNFTREIDNDEYFSHFFLDRQVLWMA